LGVVLALLALGISDMTVFAWLYLLSALAGLFFGLHLLRAQLGPLMSLVRPTLSDFGDAGAFLLLDLNSRAAGALDKLFLLRLAGPNAVGLYSAGLRVIEAASMPFSALLRSIAPRLFRRENGLDSGPRADIVAVAAVVTALGLLVAVIVYALAPLLPVLLGSDWDKSVSVVRWLALFPLLYGLHHTLLTRVVGISSPRTRLWIELLGLVTSVLLYVFLIPGFGMLGAVLGQLGSHAMAILLAVAVLLRYRQTPPTTMTPL
jgi:O-antigen/teichoic acid export membrane protein